jgi:hypothetical protein
MTGWTRQTRRIGGREQKSNDLLTNPIFIVAILFQA